MIDSYPITEYFGFTENEVKMLCKEYHMDFESNQGRIPVYGMDGCGC